MSDTFPIKRKKSDWGKNVLFLRNIFSYITSTIFVNNKTCHTVANKSHSIFFQILRSVNSRYKFRVMRFARHTIVKNVVYLTASSSTVLTTEEVELVIKNDKVFGVVLRVGHLLEGTFLQTSALVVKVY